MFLRINNTIWVIWVMAKGHMDSDSSIPLFVVPNWRRSMSRLFSIENYDYLCYTPSVIKVKDKTFVFAIHQLALYIFQNFLQTANIPNLYGVKPNFFCFIPQCGKLLLKFTLGKTVHSRWWQRPFSFLYLVLPYAIGYCEGIYRTIPWPLLRKKKERWIILLTSPIWISSSRNAFPGCVIMLCLCSPFFQLDERGFVCIRIFFVSIQPTLYQSFG